MTPTPEEIAAHGLSREEYERIERELGRAPNRVELGVFSVMWSEHCSYKSSRRHLRRLPTTGARVVQGPGENAGVVDLGEGLCVAFKMESHNHPSYIEPYQGAATGVGGIMRDVFTMGARPIACLDALRFGEPSHAKTAHLLEGVVAGVGGYGNSFGVPTVGGEVVFEACYNENCLVNVMAVGVVEKDRIFRGSAGGPGNPIIYVGAKTGRDGIHGATMASAEFGRDSEEKRPTVQVGDPYKEKCLLEACLELFRSDAVVGIQDMGAAGLTSSSVEMAGRAGTGVEIDVDRVPRREEGMTAYEVLLSESQERMLLVAKAGREAEVQRIFDKWDLDAAVVGEVTATGRLVVKERGRMVADLPIAPLTEGAPVYERPLRAPPAAPVLDLAALPEPSDYGEALLALLARPSIGSKRWVYQQYDYQVCDATIVLPGAGDAAVVRLPGPDGRMTKRGVALAVGCNARFCHLDPRLGAMHAVAECYRNISCVGGEPLAITDCLNFASPERPEVMWQFAEAIDGLAEACRALRTPVVSGNVSFYNETEGRGIWPTPEVGMVGLVEDVARTARAGFRAGAGIALVGRTIRTDAPSAIPGAELGGSEYAAMRGQVAGPVPALDLDLEARVGRAVRRMVRDGVALSAHDCSEGGLAVALAESCIASGSGARIRIPWSGRMDALLFGEEPSRIVISFGDQARVEAICKEEGAPFLILGETQTEAALVIEGVLDVPVASLARAHASALARVTGS